MSMIAGSRLAMTCPLKLLCHRLSDPLTARDDDCDGCQAPRSRVAAGLRLRAAAEARHAAVQLLRAWSQAERRQCSRFQAPAWW